MQYRIPKTLILAVLLAISLPLSAADLTGTVTNKTTNKPAVGDDVILLRLAKGMDEVARTKTDARGHFTLNVADPATAHLVRVNHRNVNYHRPAPPGTTFVDVDVFDAAESLDNISQSVDVMRLEADAGELRVVEMYGINNASNPPRTLMSPKSFEMVLPEGAKITQALAAGPGGMPVTSAPIPTGEKNHYTFLFPIRPGETRFQVAYAMPYNGSAKLDPKLLRPTENFAVSIPKSMQITPAPGSKLEAKGEDAGMSVYVAQKTEGRASVGFTVSGTGTVPLDKSSDRAEEGGTNSSEVTNRSGPGGGLGTPINTPDGLYKYRWWLIALVALMLVGGAAYSMNTPQNVASADGTTGQFFSMQHTLKEELFELESERLQNKVSPEEYAKVKAALELLILRAASRKS